MDIAVQFRLQYFHRQVRPVAAPQRLDDRERQLARFGQPAHGQPQVALAERPRERHPQLGLRAEKAVVREV